MVIWRLKSHVGQNEQTRKSKDYIMRKILKIMLSLLLIIVLSTPCRIFAASYYTFNDHKMIGGVGDYGKNKKYYYIVSNAGSHADLINGSIKQWVNTTSRLGYTTSLSFAKTTNRSNSVLDYMTTSGKGNHSDGVLAWTEFYKSGKNINPSTVNWKYCYVKIYKTNFNKLTKNGRKGTIAHEAGHAFGLAHNQGNPKSIMCQTKYGRAVSSAQICDLKGINHLYK